MDNRPIGVFDSGLGGLSVVRWLTRLLPEESVVYFGDTGRVPYGTRSTETIERYVREDSRFLLSKQVKMIIAACGTASSVAPHVLESLPVPSLGVVIPAAKAAAEQSKNGRIGVLGTAATVRSGAFEREIERLRPEAQVLSQACPLFVPLVENGWIERDNEATAAVAKRYLLPLREQGVDTLVLGCTHFPLLREIIADVMGDGVRLIDTGETCAQACVELLQSKELLASGTAEYRYYVSDRAEDFAHVAEMFLGSYPQGQTAICRIDPESLSDENGAVSF